MDGEGEDTLQLDQRVRFLSKGPRALACWQGRAEMVAVMVLLPRSPVPSDVDVDSALPTDTLFPAEDEDEEGESVISLLSHQSISVTWLSFTPHPENHSLFPSGTKNCTSGNFFSTRCSVG